MEKEDVHTHLKEVIRTFATAPNLDGNLSSSVEEINSHFAFDTIEGIIQSLEKDQSPFAQTTKEKLLSKSPVSLKVTLKQFIDGKKSQLKNVSRQILYSLKTSCDMKISLKEYAPL